MAADEGGRAGDQAAVGVAKRNIGTHGDEFVSKKHSGFVHPVVHENGSFGLGSQKDKGA